jgi:hypothetical protein
LRAFVDGFVSVLLPVYLLELSFCVFIGSIVTATLIRSVLFWHADLVADRRALQHDRHVGEAMDRMELGGGAHKRH